MNTATDTREEDNMEDVRTCPKCGKTLRAEYGTFYCHECRVIIDPKQNTRKGGDPMQIAYCNGKKGLCYDEECSGQKCPHYDGTGGHYVNTAPATTFNYDFDDREESGLLDE